MSTFWKVTFGLVVVGVAGGAIFLASRSAAAATAAKVGFRVSEDCTLIEVVDKAAAEEAAMNAAVAIFPSMSDPAPAFFDKMFAKMFPQCAGKVGEASLKVPGDNGTHVEIPLGLVKLTLHGKTVGDVKAMLMSGDFPSLESAPNGDTRDLSPANFLNQAFFGGLSG